MYHTWRKGKKGGNSTHSGSSLAGWQHPSRPVVPTPLIVQTPSLSHAQALGSSPVGEIFETAVKFNLIPTNIAGFCLLNLSLIPAQTRMKIETFQMAVKFNLIPTNTAGFCLLILSPVPLQR